MNFISDLKINYTFLCVLICLISSSIEPILAKLGYRILATPYQLLVIKFLIGGITILPFSRKFRWIGSDGFKRVLWLALLLMAISALILIALKYLPAIIVITIITTTPAFVAIVNQMFGKEVLAKNFWPGFFICFTGILLSLEIHKAWHAETSEALQPIGLLCVFASVAISTIYRTRLDEATKDFTPLLVSSYLFIINGIIALIMMPSIWPVSGKIWLIGLIVGIAAAIANLSFLWAIHLMGSTRMSIVGLLQRPIVIICAALILKEPLSVIQITGIVLVLAGIQMAKVAKRKA